MIQLKETHYTKDSANRKIRVTREFDAPVEKVWNAWTEPNLLDQWWAPKPWKANTLSMDFRSGGTWLYYMEGPEGERHYSKVDYVQIEKNKWFTGTDAFTDEQGNTITDMPGSGWVVNFAPADAGTKIDVELSFATLEDMDKLLEMGFKEGFAAAHGNLDELLAQE